MKNSAGRGGCYKTLRDLQNSYPTKAEFNNCFIIHSKYFLCSNLQTYPPVVDLMSQATF